MDKLTAVRIKYDDGTYSSQIPVSVFATNVNWDNQLTLTDVLGTVAFDTKGSIQNQIDELSIGKVDQNSLNNYISDYINNNLEDWLDENRPQVNIDATLTIQGAAADAAATGEQIAQIKEQLNDVSINVNDLGLSQDFSTGYVYPTYKNTRSTNGIQIAGGGGGQGVSIDSTSIQYATSSSGTVIPSSGWGDNIPTVSSGNYLWTKTQVIYSDETETVSYSVSRNGTNGKKGDKGDTGATGEDGRSVASVVQEYYKSTSNIAQVGGQWVNVRPSWEQGKYIWVRMKTIYSDDINNPVYTTPYLDDSANQLVDYIDQQDEDLQTQINTAQTDITTIQGNIEGISVKDDKIVYDYSFDQTGKYILTGYPLFANRELIVNPGLELYDTTNALPFIDFHYGRDEDIRDVDNAHPGAVGRFAYEGSTARDTFYTSSNLLIKNTVPLKWVDDSEHPDTLQNLVRQDWGDYNVGRILFNLGQTKQGTIVDVTTKVVGPGTSTDWVSIGTVWLPVGIYLITYQILISQNTSRTGNPYITGRLNAHIPASDSTNTLYGLQHRTRSSMYVPDNSQNFDCTGSFIVAVTDTSRNINLEVWSNMSNTDRLGGAELRATALFCQSEHFIDNPLIMNNTHQTRILRTRTKETT